MENEKEARDELEDLRQRAEQKVHTPDVPLTEMSEADIAAMVHELQVHQLELEMQNEELQRTHAELEQSRTKYADLFDFAPVGYVVLNENGMIVEANLTATTMLQVGRTKLKGKPLVLYLLPGSKDVFRHHYQAVFKTGQPQECQVEIKRNEGKGPLALRLQSQPVVTEDGSVAQCRTAMTNVTALVRTERRLKDSERRFRTLAENSPDIIARVDRDLRVLYVNGPIEGAFGIPSTEFVGHTFEEMGVPEILCVRWTDAIERVFKTAKTGRFDFDSPGPQGVRHHTATLVPEFEEDGTLNTVLITVRDITDRVDAEEKYSTVIRSLQDGFCIVDAEGHYLEVNETYSQMLGVDRDEILQLTLWDVLAPELHQELADHMQKALGQGWDKFRIRHRRRDGSAVDCDVTSQRLNGDRLFVFARDITGQRIVQDQIAFQARILADVSDAVIAVDHDSRVTYWNKAAEQIYEIPADQAIGKRLDDLFRYRWFSPEDEKAVMDRLEHEATWRGTTIHTKNNGEELIVESSASYLKDGQSGRLGILFVMRDITEQYHAEQQRVETLRRLQLVARATDDGVWDWDVKTDALWHNEAYLTSFGYPPNEPDVSIQWWKDRIHPEDRDSVLAAVEEALQDGADRWTSRYRFRRKDGSYAWVIARAYVLRDPEGKAVRAVGVMLDMTEKLEMLDQLESERSKLAMVLDTALTGIIVVDERGAISYANPAAQRLHGQPMPPGASIESHRPMGLHHLDGTPCEPRDVPVVRSALYGETHREAELLIQRPDGETRHIMFNTSPLIDRGGKIAGAVAVLQDITELKVVEKALHEARDQSEERVRERTAELDHTVETLHQEVAEKIAAQDRLIHQNAMLQKIIDTVPVMLCFFDDQGNIGLVNDEFTHILGYSLEDFREHNLIELAGPAEQDRQEFRDHMMTPGPEWRDFFAQAKDGDKIISSWATVRLPDGSYVGIGLDIRERRQFENRIRESEERYRTLVELSPDAIGVERDGILQFVNTTAVKLLGARSREDLVGRPLLELVHPDDRPRAEREFTYLHKRRPLPPTEDKLVRLDGTTLDVELAAIPILFEGRPANQVVLHDITQRKQVEVRLQENARLLQQQAELLNLAHDSIVVNDMEGRVVFWNPGAEQTYGWTRAEALGKISHDLLKTRFPSNLIEITARLLSQGRWNGELTHTTKAGQTIIVSSRWALQRNEDSLPTGILVIDRDITLQKHAEQALVEARQFAESITDTVQESLLVLNRDLQVISANQTFYRVFGGRPEETRDRYIYEVGNGQWDIPGLRRLLEDILPHNTSFEDFEVEHDFEGIGHRTMLLNARRVYRQEQEIEMILLAIQDITVRKEQETKIREHQHELASLTEKLLLAEERERHRIALVLHDSIGQFLAFSKRELSVLQKRSPESVRTELEYVKQQIELAIRQTRDLTFELSPTTLHTFGLEAAIEELVEQFATRGKLRYHFEATEDDKPLTEQISTLLYRAARELLTNIIKHAEATNVSIRIDRQEKNVRMVIEDDGRGFDVSQLERADRHQEGFGLFSIRERLTYVGGRFAIESRPGEGTKVTLIAPLNPENLVKSRSGKS